MNDHDDEEKPPPSRRSFPTDKSVGKTVADSVLQFVSIRPRKNPRKKARAEGGGNESKMLGGEEEMYIYIYIGLCLVFSKKGGRERRETRET